MEPNQRAKQMKVSQALGQSELCLLASHRTEDCMDSQLGELGGKQENS